MNDQFRLDRRDFLKIGAGGLFALSWNRFSAAGEASDSDAEELNIVPIKIAAGADAPFTAVHFSDTHLCYADERDNGRKRELAVNRRRYFSAAEAKLAQTLLYAKNRNRLILHTGDLIDFVSYQNLDKAKSAFEGTNSFVSSGNHEFSQYVGEAKEDDAYKAQSFDRVQEAYPNDLTFCSRVVNGVNFIAFDDVYYNMTHSQLEKFQAEAKKGLPMVAMCHCPLYTPELLEYAMEKEKGGCAYLTGVPEEKMSNYEPSRRQQQRTDDPTQEFIDALRKEPLLKAVLCGHLHYFWDGPFSETAHQYVVGGHFAGNMYEIEFC